MNLKNCITVVIATKDRAEDLKRFLASLDQQTLQPGELIIVDASKDPSTADMIRVRKQSAIYPITYLQSRPGLTAQRNIGIEHSTGRFICFFDDDIVLDTDYLEVVHGTFLENAAAGVGGIAGRITNTSGTRHPIDSLIKKVFFLTDSGSGRLKPSGFPEHRNDGQKAFVNVLSGCCMAYSREVLADFKFDERLTGYCYLEDIDFSYRVSKKYRLLYQPRAKCRHFATTYKTADSRSLRYMLARNHLYLFRKNLPNDLMHLYAFGMSLIGLFVSNAVMLKDINACRGIIAGLMKPLPPFTQH